MRNIRKKIYKYIYISFYLYIYINKNKFFLLIFNNITIDTKVDIQKYRLKLVY